MARRRSFTTFSSSCMSGPTRSRVAGSASRRSSRCSASRGSWSRPSGRGGTSFRELVDERVGQRRGPAASGWRSAAARRRPGWPRPPGRRPQRPSPVIRAGAADHEVGPSVYQGGAADHAVAARSPRFAAAPCARRRRDRVHPADQRVGAPRRSSIRPSSSRSLEQPSARSGTRLPPPRAHAPAGPTTLPITLSAHRRPRTVTPAICTAMPRIIHDSGPGHASVARCRPFGHGV